ncbi:NAD(P)H-binding protein [Streptomyces sp. NPDC051569]|uniref:NmrA family NAD(P)-binding protein n=1 Tax=Streptomyces sp. NPDC051569 TaxID=3365661 RepID=UPI00379155F8
MTQSTQSNRTARTQQAEKTTTLVIGGTGKTGRRVAARLAAQGLPVRVGSRHAHVPFVWEAPSTWEAALEGVGAVYVAYHPDLAFPGAAEAVGAFSRYAVARGAVRLVLLSGRGEEGARQGELKLRESGADWTILRCSWFNQNFSESFFLGPVLDGELALPTGDAVEAFLDVDDVAEVAVAALTDPQHIGRIYELSGPRLMSYGEVADELSKATGRPVIYTPVTCEQYRAVLEEKGLPVAFAELFGIVLDGRNTHLVHGVEEALGRKPRDFSEFARDAATTGVWNV